ncbi:hypothetical protein CRE_06835 [Caenorhabditis remanei]|uniref:BTB domain-containing protein n=1 Tax=Caenorhabditis remanei TaxID=31234 RepID=E3MZH5_CAERE|nr:hypothetical protein CRE_06835 [Caenorhabditis remanei]
MENKTFEYSSKRADLNGGLQDIGGGYGLRCMCSNYGKTLEWKFDWDELKPQGIIGFTGHIEASVNRRVFKIDVDANERFNTFLFPYSEHGIPSKPKISFCYNYALEARYFPTKQYNAFILPSDFADVILKIEDKTLHVNKAFLSMHSEYFRALFSENYKEGNMDEIEIKEISYLDMCLLLGTIYPDTIFPVDSTVDQLLELADRFMMPCVIRHVEHHLFNCSKIGKEKILCIADKFGMEKLLDKTIKEISSVQEAKLLKTCEECKELSENTKLKLYHKLMEII